MPEDAESTGCMDLLTNRTPKPRRRSSFRTSPSVNRREEPSSYRYATAQREEDPNERSALHELSERMHEMKNAHRQELRSVLHQNKDLKERLNQLNHENQQLRSDLNQKEKELRESRTRKGTSSCQRCERQTREHKQEMAAMEAFYKDKLNEARSAMKKKEEDFKSFKDRVAENMYLSLKTENTENMNSPVNQSRLKEMYDQLRVRTWPKINLKSSEKDARKLVQEKFGAAAEHVKALRTSIKTVSGVKEPLSPKVEKFRQSALENLQLALFHSSKQDVFKAVFPQFDGGPAELQLASECYWLGCLMALHTPPLYPHWDKDSADRGSCDVFPFGIRSDKCPEDSLTEL